MKTKTYKAPKVNIVTMGCSKNLIDSELLSTQLKHGGIVVEHEASEQDYNVVVINTCGFIDSAKQESIDMILQYSQAKKDGLIDKFYITGCLSQRYREELAEEFPEADAIFGTSELSDMLKQFKVDYKKELIGERESSTLSHYAYLKISEGCDRKCSFCAIPLIRGKHISYSIESLMKEAQHLANKGVKELILIAQDLTFYGLDIYGERSLHKLLKELVKIEGIEWIRLHYAYPSGFPMEVIDVMAAEDKICNYLDIPFQHGADKMLKVMRRGITAEKTEKLLVELRTRIPDIAIRTAVIAGHPEETEVEMEEMISFVERSQFDRLGVFTYSHEEDTHSFTYEDKLSEDEKNSRANRIMAVQEEISLQLNQNRIGKTLKVIIDRIEGEQYIGRTEYDSPEVDNEVIITTDKKLQVGTFVQAKINDATEFDLLASV